ncbi:zinc finger protein OZF-like [Nerophis ophidion]|uniref:zinc finger protein OZF-like n=1 Tax=Nerophis ophidion TaxID=159077 RepID=UPI002ADFF527|nr:zinc finger protein OZF-like [Nerophis ophidion]
MCERRMAEYEEELPRTKEEKERQRRLLDAVCKKHQVVLHKTDFQQLTGHGKESPPKLQGRDSILKQEDQQPPHFKEEKKHLKPIYVKEKDKELKNPHVKAEEEDPQPPHCTEEEEGACLLRQEEADLTVVSVKTEDHEEKTPESSQLHHSPNVQQLIGHQEEPLSLLLEVSSPLKQKDPQPPHIKEEEEELCITQEGEYLLGQKEADLTNFPLIVVSVKTEDHKDKPPESSQLHHSPSEEKREVEPPSSSSPQHMTTDGDGDHCGGSEADNLLAPLSDGDESHMKTHTGEKTFVCSVCGKLSSQKRNMQIHMRRHTGEKLFSCSVCAKPFVTNSDLTRHMRTHTGEKPFICSNCGRKFSQRVTMLSHMRTHTGEKPFRCSVCGNLFSEKHNMQIHMRRHLGEKPFSCSLCVKVFSEKHTMQIHMRRHRGEKPFSCSVCAKNFVAQSDLTRHMRTHSGEKPYICSNCGKKFSRKERMLSHMRTHTGE